MKFAYLLVMLFTLSYPLYKSFEDKIHYFSKWKYVFKATLPVASFFILWDNWFTWLGVWQFNPTYILNIFVGYLPLEEYLFFFFVPFSCLFIHEVLYYFVKKDVLGKYATLLSWLLIAVSFILLIAFRDRTYPVILFTLLILFLLIHLIFIRSAYMGRFYLSFAVSIVPFLLVNGLLTGLPVISYNLNEIMRIYLFTIPLEDLFYGLLMLLLITTFYEYFKTKGESGKIRF